MNAIAHSQKRSVAIGFTQFDCLGKGDRFDKRIYVNIVTRGAPRYNVYMIKSFRHKGLQQFFETGSTAKIQPKHIKSLRFRLELLNRVEILSTLPPQLKLHPLKGNKQGRWSISVSGNWRLTFEFRDGDVYILDYEDYH